jgi:hypothetical protein
MEDTPIGLGVALAVAAAVQQVPQRCWDQRQDHPRPTDALRVKCGPGVLLAALLGMVATMSMRST